MLYYVVGVLHTRCCNRVVLLLCFSTNSQLAYDEIADVERDLRHATKCRDASHYDILGLNKFASRKDIIKVVRIDF